MLQRATMVYLLGYVNLDSDGGDVMLKVMIMSFDKKTISQYNEAYIFCVIIECNFVNFEDIHAVIKWKTSSNILSVNSKYAQHNTFS